MMRHAINMLARLSAIVGGVVLLGLIMLVCLSVLGRGISTFAHWDWFQTALPAFSDMILATGVGPITGEYEVVEAGIAFAIFCFLPICHLHRQHAKVELISPLLPPKVRDALGVFWDISLALVTLLIAQRLFEGMTDKMRYGETSFLLQFPLWWAYAASFGAAVVASIVSSYCAVSRAAALFVTPSTDGAQS